MKTVAVSGGFDPLHIGHLKMFKEARLLGDRLVVILNCDAWLMRKKGYVFMPAIQRAAIIGSLACVDEVYIHESDDDDVSGALEKLRPDVFANGGDRHANNIPEYKVCEELNIEMAFNIGGGKIESSSDMVQRAVIQENHEERPWGSFTVLNKQRKWWVKIIDIKPGGRLSLQRHEKRAEFWICVEGNAQAFSGGGTAHELHVGSPPIKVPSNTWHRLSSEKGARIIGQRTLVAPLERGSPA